MIKMGLRPYLERIEPLAGKIPLHPTTITFLGLVFAIAGAITVTVSPGVAFVFFLLAFATDAVDGAVARAKKLTSRKGAFLDGILDRVVEFFLIMALWTGFGWTVSEQIALISILFFGTAMTSFVKAYAEHSGMLEHEKAVAMPGILERPERSILLLAIFACLLLGLGWNSWLLYAAAILSLATFLQRVFQVLSKS